MVIIYTAHFWALDVEHSGHPYVCGKGAGTASVFLFGSLDVRVFCETREGSLPVQAATSTYVYSGSFQFSIPR